MVVHLTETFGANLMRNAVRIENVEHSNDKFKDLGHRVNNVDIVDLDSNPLKAPTAYLGGADGASDMTTKDSALSANPCKTSFCSSAKEDPPYGVR